MAKVICGNECFEYRIIRKKKKNIGIMITPEGEVVVSSPYHVDDKYINELVQRKSSWILSKLGFMKETVREVKEKEYITGKEILYLWRSFKLEVTEGSVRTAEIGFDGEFIRVTVNPGLKGEKRQEKVKEKLVEWYKDEALRVFKERTAVYSKLLNLYPEMIRVKEQKTIWGSCSSLSNINYNWKLIMAPVDIIDYIVVHELCHLKHRDHSKEFWSLVEHTMPDYRDKKEWLRINGRSLAL